MWLRNPRFQRLIGGSFLERISIRMVGQLELIGLRGHKEPSTLKLIDQIRRERRWLVTANEAFLVHSLARSAAKLPGSMAEVGVYQGGTAKMICAAKGDAPLHLFDTFAGLPESSAADGQVHVNGQYACSLDSVRSYLRGYGNVHFHQGRFPDGSSKIENDRFSFVHFDVDLYQSTLDCLRFFYHRMLPGAVILSHDYSILAGVRQAFAEFLADMPEELVELPSTQCLIIKL